MKILNFLKKIKWTTRLRIFRNIFIPVILLLIILSLIPSLINPHSHFNTEFAILLSIPIVTSIYMILAILLLNCHWLELNLYLFILLLFTPFSLGIFYAFLVTLIPVYTLPFGEIISKIIAYILLGALYIFYFTTLIYAGYIYHQDKSDPSKKVPKKKIAKYVLINFIIIFIIISLLYSNYIIPAFRSF